MEPKIVSCAICGKNFVAKHPAAKYCSDRCRKRRQRNEARDHGMPGSRVTGLVAAVQSELERAGALETYPGQLALELARKVSGTESSGMASMSKELRTVMDAALAGMNPGSAEADDLVEELKRKRAQGVAG